MALGMDVGLIPGDFVLDGEPVPPLDKGRSPLQIFGPCLLSAGWIKMPLGMEVGLDLRDIVFDEAAATPRKRAHPLPPNFWPMSIVAKWLVG